MIVFARVSDLTLPQLVNPSLRFEIDLEEAIQEITPCCGVRVNIPQKNYRTPDFLVLEYPSDDFLENLKKYSTKYLLCLMIKKAGF